MKPAAVSDPAQTLEGLLAKHAIVLVGGSARVVAWKPRGLYPGDTGNVIDLMHEAAFRLYYRHLYVLAPVASGGTTRVSLAARFFDVAERYPGLVYAPGEGEVVSGQFNMWRGFGVTPAAGDWTLMQAHIKNVLAAGDDEVAEYMENWCAWTMQHPGERAEVALVLRGGKGAGKGVLGTALTRIFGSHGLHISSRKHLVGGFNMHMAHCSLLFADEAYWPGDKAGEGELKRLITEPTLVIEPKGVDPFQVRNSLHVIIAGNEEWLVPASGDERRFAVVGVSAARQGDLRYFARLYDELSNGGLAAMLYDLLARDLGDWHPRDAIPQTRALRYQQQQSRKGVDALIEELAHEGQLPCAAAGHPDIAVTTGEADRTGFWHYAKGTVPDLRHKHCRAIMAELKAWGCTPYHSKNVRGVCFPALADLRQRFTAKFGPQDWDGPGVWEESG